MEHTQEGFFERMRHHFAHRHHHHHGRGHGRFGGGFMGDDDPRSMRTGRKLSSQDLQLLILALMGRI